MADVVGEADVDHYDDDIAQADFVDRRKADNENRKEPETGPSGPRAQGGIEAQQYGSEHEALAQQQAGGGATARSGKSRSRPRNPAVYIDGLPVYIPEAAMNPVATAGPAATSRGGSTGGGAAGGRDRDTLIVNRTTRGKQVLAAKNIGSPQRPGTSPGGKGKGGMNASTTSFPLLLSSTTPTGGPHSDKLGLRDFSSYYKTTEPKYHKSYLDEVAYATSFKERMEKKREAELYRQRFIDAKSKSQYMAGGMLPGGKAIVRMESREGGGDSAMPFFDRQEAAEKRRMQAREQASAQWKYDHEHPDKLSCPKCGQVQSFAEYQARQRKCPREACGGALYRPKLLWSEVQGSFLGRWQQFMVDKEKHREELLALPEITPPTRLTSVTRYDPESKTWITTDIPERAWDDVRHSFDKRNAETLERLKAREDAYLNAKTAPTGFNTHTKAKPYKFSQPLPPFFDRQMAMMENKNASFEERLEMLKDL